MCIRDRFGTVNQLKRELITEACATIAFSAIQNNDKVGLILFSDQVELFIPPKKGRGHILRIVRELLEFRPKKSGTDVAMVVSSFSLLSTLLVPVFISTKEPVP